MYLRPTVYAKQEDNLPVNVTIKRTNCHFTNSALGFSGSLMSLRVDKSYWVCYFFTLLCFVLFYVYLLNLFTNKSLLFPLFLAHLMPHLSLNFYYNVYCISTLSVILLFLYEHMQSLKGERERERERERESI